MTMNTNIHAIFGTNSALEEDGAWVVVNEFYGLKIKVRRTKADSVVKAQERIIKEEMGETKLRKPNDIDPAMWVRIIDRLIAEAILVDWTNLRDAETGEEIPFSGEAAAELVKIKDFKDFIWQAANERDTFRTEADEEAEGN